MEKLHEGAKWLFRIKSYISLVFLVFFLSSWILGISLIVNEGETGIVWIYGFSSLFFIILIGEIYSRLAYKYWKYELGERELKVEKGIIFKSYKSIPYERVQNVDISRGIIARLCGFSTINVQTAGYSYSSGGHGGAMSEGHIPAVSIESAEKIREFILSKIGRKQGI